MSEYIVSGDKLQAYNTDTNKFAMDSSGALVCAIAFVLTVLSSASTVELNYFCEEDLSIKHLPYHCCLLRGNKRLNCFHNDAPNPNYEATEELLVLPLPSSAPFNFDPNTCQRTVMKRKKEKKPVTSQKVDIRFPPGRPTAAVIESLCRNQKIRPLYSNKCLPNIGYEWLARQAKTINRMEKGFKQCCKKRQDVVVCAEQKWREELNKFCLHKNSDETSSRCCLDNGENDRFDCFQNISPDPHYNMTSVTEELSLNKICDTHKIIKKKFPVGFPLKYFVDKCCPLYMILTTCSICLAT
ncbi:extracellular matrix protein 1-like [Scomber scombrus]|uniref:extracellular matrix protein 1-like n=1 Tax=Scomber scombrus TaxID=13677 RepID=UPI002DDA3FA8|nr:extracellular matrix protein 1-like [Scomber scombrus]